VTEGQLGIMLLVVSVVSLCVQSTALFRIFLSEHSGNLLRTALCRVAAACAYVGVGANAIVLHRSPLSVSLIVFTGVQIMWWGNASADVRLNKRGISDDRSG